MTDRVLGVQMDYLGAIDARQFGAKFDGESNDTAPLQAALDYAASLGGRRTVLMPPGNAIIQPASIAAGKALLVSGDGVELRGAGRTKTKLVFRLYDGSDPSTHWPIVNGAVMRGNAINIAGGSTRIRLAGFEVDGGAGYTGDNQFPSSLVDGDGWDLTHKAVYLTENTTIDDVEIVNCHLHSFRGELIYYGGSGLTNVLARGNKLGDTNGDGYSVSAGGCEVRDNEIYQCSGNGIECNYDAGYSLYRDNRVRDCGLQGIAVFPVGAQSTGFVDIINNRVVNCYGAEVSGVWITGARNMRVRDNVIVDCPRGITIGFGGEFHDSEINNVLIRDNQVLADTKDVDSMIFLSVASPRGLIIRDNVGLVTARGVANGKTFRRGINMNEVGAYTGTFGDGCYIDNNHVIGTQNADSDAQSIGRQRPSATGGAVIALLNTLYNPAFARVDASWHVTTPTTLDITVQWTDENNVGRTQSLCSGSQSVGFGSASWSGVVGHGSVLVAADSSVQAAAKVSAKIEQHA